MEEVDKRQRVVQEIVQTEQTYVNRLQLLISMYIEPLKQQNIISDLDAQALFNNWQIIAGLNIALLRDLQASLEQGKDNFGSLFREFSPYFRMYSSYLNNYENALERRATLMTKNGQFARFLEQAQQDPRSTGLSIADLLIEPVQRIPRYKLLLEQLLKYTPESHADHGNIVAALASVSSAAQHNNEQIRRREMREQIVQIMTQFDSSSEASLNLMDTPSRVFIREAVMQKLCRRGPKEFKFWLFNDKLLYGEQKASGKYCLNRDIELAACRVTTVSNAKAPDRAFMIESPSKSFVVWSNTPEEKDEWLRDIENCIQVLREKYQQETGRIAPVWTPDSAVSKCQICGAKFGLVLRRHHCRQCGEVVCGNCSKRTMLLEHIDPDKPQRVCDECYTELSGTAPEAPKDYGIVIPPPGIGFTPPTQPPTYKPRPPPPRDGMPPNGEPALARTQSTPVLRGGNPTAGFTLPPRPPVPMSKVGSTGDLKMAAAAAASGPDAATLSSSPALAPPAPISKIAPGAQVYAQAVGGTSPPAQSSMPSVPPQRPPPPRPPGHSTSSSMGALPVDAAVAATAEPAVAAGAGGLAPPPPLSKVLPGAGAYAAATGASQPPGPPPKPEKALPNTPPPTPPQSQSPVPPSSPSQAERPTSQAPTPPVPSMPRPAAPAAPSTPATSPPSVPSSAPPSVPSSTPPSAPPKPPKLAAAPEPAVASSTAGSATTTRPRPPGSRGGPSAAARSGSPTAKATTAAARAPAASGPVAVGAGVPFEQLKNMTMEMMPPGVEYTQREVLLSDEEFVALFGCSKADFNGMPAWKRNNKKKSLGLF